MESYEEIYYNEKIKNMSIKRKILIGILIVVIFTGFISYFYFSDYSYRKLETQRKLAEACTEWLLNECKGKFPAPKLIRKIMEISEKKSYLELIAFSLCGCSPLKYEKVCRTDEDCVPEQCCYPYSCINKKYKKDCSQVKCPQRCPYSDCRPIHCQCILAGPIVNGGISTSHCVATKE